MTEYCEGCGGENVEGETHKCYSTKSIGDVMNSLLEDLGVPEHIARQVAFRASVERSVTLRCEFLGERPTKDEFDSLVDKAVADSDLYYSFVDRLRRSTSKVEMQGILDESRLLVVDEIKQAGLRGVYEWRRGELLMKYKQEKRNAHL